jgi:hypothetical protein
MVQNPHEGGIRMDRNKYSKAGWISIASAAIFPLLFMLGFVENIVKFRAFGFSGPHVGPSDAIGILHAIFCIYVLIMLRKFLNERLEFRGIDTLITISIWWLILFQFLGTALKGILMLLWPIPEVVYAVSFGSFLVVMLIFIGVVDILIGVRLFGIKKSLSSLLLAYAYVTLIGGIFEVSLIFAGFALILVPVTNVILGILLIKAKDQVVEFV